MQKLELDAESVQAISRDHTYIAYDMTYYQQIKPSGLPYKEFGIKLLKYISNCARSATHIVVHLNNSIKDVKRTRRSGCILVMKQTVASSLIKQWNQLLSSGLKLN